MTSAVGDINVINHEIEPGRSEVLPSYKLACTIVMVEKDDVPELNIQEQYLLPLTSTEVDYFQ